MSRKARNVRRSKPTASVAIIGAGRVGTALALSLKECGFQIKVIVAKHAATARRAGLLVGKSTRGVSAAQLSRFSPSELATISRSRLIIIATPDDAIAQVAASLAKLLGPVSCSTGGRSFSATVLHTSGARSSEELQPLARLGFATGSLHPLIAISDPRKALPLLSKCFYAIEGTSKANRIARSLVRSLGGQPFSIRAENKALYHAAALTASPNLIALFDVALEMLSRCGLSRARGRRILLPLVLSTLANLSDEDPAKALTGPFRRGDAETVKKHLAALRSENLENALDVYLTLGRRALSLSLKNQPTEGHLELNRMISSIKSNRGDHSSTST